MKDHEDLHLYFILRVFFIEILILEGLEGCVWAYAMLEIKLRVLYMQSMYSTYRSISPALLLGLWSILSISLLYGMRCILIFYVNEYSIILLPFVAKVYFLTKWP